METKDFISKNQLKEYSKQEIQEFKKFAFKQNMIELAVAFILGAAFQKVVNAISNNLIMPFVNFCLTQTGANWRDWNITITKGFVLEIGQFIGNFLDFVIISIVLYIVYKKLIVGAFKKIECIETIVCPNCYNTINYRCKVCPYCTRKVRLYVKI